MNRKIFVNRFLPIFLTITILCSFLTSCKGGQTPTEESGTTDATPENVLVLIENTISNCTIIHPYKNATKESSIAYALANMLKSIYGSVVKVTDDFEDNKDASAVEILIGNVNRTESMELYETLEDDSDWAIWVSGNKLAIVAASDEGYDRAIGYFEEMYLTGGTTLSVSRDLFYGTWLSQNEILKNVVQNYTIVYAKNSNSRVKNAVQTLKAGLEQYSDGKAITVTDDTAEKGAYEILIGNTNRPESTTGVQLSYYDYLIRTEGNKIMVNAGGGFAVEDAVDQLLELLITQELGDEYLYRFDTSIMNPLAFNPDNFVPVWKGSRTVPSWMTDFEEKLYAITNPSGRMMSVAHRGDVMNYPENSLEGFLSAAALGADVIEMDLQLTKDGILVLGHDATLGTTTNVKDMKGKNGLPISETVSDWTYAQLQQLSLLDRDGNLTKYKIPSYYEILLALRGKCFIMIDTKISQELFTKEDVLDMATATDSLELSFYAMFVSGTASGGPTQSDSANYMIAYSKKNPQLVRFATYAQKLESYLKMSGHKIRTRSWPGTGATTNPYSETFDVYKSCYQTGKKLLYTNNIPLLSEYISKNFQTDISTRN